MSIPQETLQKTYIFYNTMTGQFNLADKTQGEIAAVLPLPMHSGIPGMSVDSQFGWCHWIN